MRTGALVQWNLHNSHPLEFNDLTSLESNFFEKRLYNFGNLYSKCTQIIWDLSSRDFPRDIMHPFSLQFEQVGLRVTFDLP